MRLAAVQVHRPAAQVLRNSARFMIFFLRLGCDPQKVPLISLQAGMPSIVVRAGNVTQIRGGSGGE
jgi:hypothetical protein